MDKTVDTREHLYDLLKDFDTAMLITCASDRTMRARPMGVAELNTDGSAYFVTSIDSPKVAQIEAESAVTLSFQSARQFASVCGRASMVRDPALVERLWSETWKVWFPQGKTDPKISMIRFTAHEAEYWDSAGVEGLKFVFDSVKAYVTGQAPPEDETQHAKVQLRG
jgi:general stress protein 26